MGKLDEIRQRWAIRPWHCGMYGDICYDDADGDEDVVASVYRADVRRAIAAAPADVAWLVGEVERLQARVDELEEEVEMACEQPDPDCDCPGCSYAESVGGDRG